MTEERRAPRAYRCAKPKRQRARETRQGVEEIVRLQNEGRTPRAIASQLPVDTQVVETILKTLK